MRLPAYIPKTNEQKQQLIQNNSNNITSIKRLIKCKYVEDQIEHKPGCNGMMCSHNCELALPAVPGGFCQQCNKYEPESSGLGWVEGMGIVENK
jgi:hypothetical protein